MESKLKTLKVVELKEILTKASVSAPAKANKQDLIAKILSNTSAVQVYRSLYAVKPAVSNESKDDLLAPPEQLDWGAEDPAVEPKSATKHKNIEYGVDWNPEDPVVEPKPVPKPKTTTSAPAPTPKKPAPPTTAPVAKEAPKTTAVKPVPKSAPSPPKTAAATPNATATSKDQAPPEDEELRLRKARAERFGIPLVEPTKPKTLDDPAKIEARKRRFGHVTLDTPTKEATGRKRGAPTEVIDDEEKERRRKRAERFGLKS